MRAAEAEALVHATGSSVHSGSSQAGSVSSYSVSGYQSLMSQASMRSTDKAEVGVRVGMITPQHIPQQTPQPINGNRKPSQIVLKGKLNLPEGFGPLKPYQRLLAKTGGDDSSVTSGSVDDDSKSSLLLTSAALSRLSISNSKPETEKRGGLRSKMKFKGGRLGRVKEEDNNDEEGGDSEHNEDDDDNDDDDSDYDDNETETINTTASIMRMRGETPEQRKARKNLVRQE
jgi:hypothetical protein